MAKQLQLRKGTDTEHNTFTGALGEVTVDTTNKTLRVHDGSTVGGIRLATVTGGLVPAAQLPAATTSTQGVVVLNNTLTSTNTNQALTAAQGKVLNDQAFGVGQTWTALTGSRVIGTTYTNSTGKPIQVCMSVDINNAHFFINGVDMYIPDYDGFGNHYFIVPNGQTYRLEGAGGIHSWSELR